jgi:hypothetical protein
VPIVNNNIDAFVNTLSEELRREQLYLADLSPEEKKESLRKILGEKLAAVTSEEVNHVLEMLKKRFPHRVHERDFELEKYRKQLKVLAEENRMLHSKLAAPPQESASPGLLQDVGAHLLNSLGNQDFKRHKGEYAARVSDSLEKIVMFVKELGENYTKILHLLGVEEPSIDIVQFFKDRLAEEVDPGPEKLEKHLTKLRQRIFTLTEVQQETIIAGVHKILDELDPERLGMVKDKTDIQIGPFSLPHRRDKWRIFEKAFTAIRKTPRNKLYRKYFEEDFKHTFLEREKNVTTQEKV